MSDLYNNEFSSEEKKSFWEKVVDAESVDVSEVVKQCCSVEGIPDKSRKLAWKFLLSKQLDEEVNDNLGGYEELAATDDSELKDVIADIDADIEKCKVDEDKHDAIRKIHKAYLLYDKKRAFIPGTSTLLNMLLDYFTEAEVFSVFGALFYRVWPEGRLFDVRGFLVEQRVVKSILFDKDPQIIMHANESGMSFDCILLRWMLTFFANDISVELTKRFFDNYFCAVYSGEGKIGFAAEVYYFATVVEVLRTVSKSYMKEKEAKKADKAESKAQRALTESDFDTIVANARTLSREIPSHKVSAFREKHEMANKGEMESRDRNLWGGSDVTFKEGSLGLTLKSVKKMLSLGRYRRNPDGTPGAAEESGLLIPGVILVAINEDEITEGMSVSKASKKIKQLKDENGQVVLRFQLLSALEQKKEEESSKKSSYKSDDYMPDYLDIGETIIRNTEVSIRVPDVATSFYVPGFEMHKGRMFLTNYRLIFHPYLKLKKSAKKSPRTPRSPRDGEEEEGGEKTPVEVEEGETVLGPLGQEDIQYPLLKIEKLVETGPRMLSMTLKDKMVVNMMYSSSKTMDQFLGNLRKAAIPSVSDDVFAFR